MESIPNERICFPAMERICSLQNNFFRINKSILEDFATQASEQEVINAGSFINGSKTQRCTATVPCLYTVSFNRERPGRVAQSVGHLTRKSGVLGSIPGLATYFRFSFRFFKKGSCQLLAKVCARSTG